MNKILVTASLIAALTAVVHIVAGGADVAAPLLVSSLAAEPKFTLYGAWHLISVALVLSSVALLIASFPRHAQAARYLVLFIATLWCSFGVVFLAVAAAQPDGGWFLKLPQWVLLLPVGMLGFWGSSNHAFKAEIAKATHP